ncbi:hypothetical protein HK100_006679, partial [Physocladia obscura]
KVSFSAAAIESANASAKESAGFASFSESSSRFESFADQTSFTDLNNSAPSVLTLANIPVMLAESIAKQSTLLSGGHVFVTLGDDL